VGEEGRKEGKKEGRKEGKKERKLSKNNTYSSKFLLGTIALPSNVHRFDCILEVASGHH
jgi:predicted transposase YdaD